MTMDKVRYLFQTHKLFHTLLLRIIRRITLTLQQPCPYALSLKEEWWFSRYHDQHLPDLIVFSFVYSKFAHVADMRRHLNQLNVQQ